MTLKSLSSREKILALVVGGIIFIFTNVFLLNLFFDSSNRLHAELHSKELQLHAMRMLASQETLWRKRDAWLAAKQPKLGNGDNAGVQLMGQIKEAARKNQVLLDHPAIGSPDQRGEYISVSVQFETKSAWAGILAFLQEIQTPEQFIAVESGNLKVDDEDHTKMRGRFKVARWYAPSQTPNPVP